MTPFSQYSSLVNHPLELIFSSLSYRSLARQLHTDQILIKPLENPFFLDSHHTAHISLYSKSIALSFKVHLSDSTHTLLQDKYPQQSLEQLLDWSKEFCNLVAGLATRLVESAEIQFVYSLATQTRSYFNIFSSEYHKCDSHHSWVFTTPLGELPCSIIVHRFEPSLSFLALSAQQIHEATQPLDPEFL